MRIALALCALALAAPPALAQAPLAGPDGTSLNKVLVIGTDGTRWDLLETAMKAGRAPNLARLRREGFGPPALLEYGPNTFTLSEVGWSSIASGVWEDKHGVDGSKFNMDPGQATKNGYLDFLTRIENRRARLSTFLASDWDNIGLAENGGPIFGSAMDANFAARVPVETIDAWDRGRRAGHRRGRRATCAAATPTPASSTSASSTRPPTWPARRPRPTPTRSRRPTRASASCCARSARGRATRSRAGRSW